MEGEPDADLIFLGQSQTRIATSHWTTPPTAPQKVTRSGGDGDSIAMTTGGLLRLARQKVKLRGHYDHANYMTHTAQFISDVFSYSVPGQKSQYTMQPSKTGKLRTNQKEPYWPVDPPTASEGEESSRVETLRVETRVAVETGRVWKDSSLPSSPDNQSERRRGESAPEGAGLENKSVVAHLFVRR